MSIVLRATDLEVGYDVRSGPFGFRRGVVRAVDRVSLLLQPGEVLGLVGESGCGKTTVARTLVGLIEPHAGRIEIDGKPIWNLPPSASLRYRHLIQMVFQDPFDSLNPRKTVRQTLAQPLRIHRVVDRAGIGREVARLLELVGLPASAARLYPHQFSGGQRQRVCIARALAPRPRIIIADEAVSALDISIRAQILALLHDLRERLGLAYLFITHDLAVVRSVCDRVAVMYLGRIVEEGPTEALFSLPRHPYTRALLAASPIPDPVRARKRIAPPIDGEPPSALSPPGGCHFHTRCQVAHEICRTEVPVPLDFHAGHRSACHLAADAESWGPVPL